MITNKRVFIINDTHRESFLHLGCKIVMENIYILCKKYDLEVVGSDKDISEVFDETLFSNSIKDADCVIVNGEGTLHDNAGMGIFNRIKIVKELNKKIVLINAVWQNNFVTKQYLNYFDLICVREGFSLKEIIGDGAKNAFCVPDLTFYSANNIIKALIRIAKERSWCA